ncbi:transcription initiation factor TFIID subunit 3 [Branchiostoma belcheri]|nr:transcription initiation factor TFIID subunit 3 [Branchiostoma belcheri]
MADPFTRRLLRVCVAQICQTLGWHAVQTTPCEVLTDILHRYLEQVSRTAHRYSEQFGRTEPNLDDLGLAFGDLSMNLQEIEHYIANVEPVPFAHQLPSFPLPKNNSLNIPEPGSKQARERRGYIPEHLPPLPADMDDPEEELPQSPAAMDTSQPLTSAEPDLHLGAPSVAMETDSLSPHLEQRGLKRPPTGYEGTPPKKRPYIAPEESQSTPSALSRSGFSLKGEGVLPEARTPPQPKPVPPEQPKTVPVLKIAPVPPPVSSANGSAPPTAASLSNSGGLSVTVSMPSTVSQSPVKKPKKKPSSTGDKEKGFKIKSKSPKGDVLKSPAIKASLLTPKSPKSPLRKKSPGKSPKRPKSPGAAKSPGRAKSPAVFQPPEIKIPPEEPPPKSPEFPSPPPRPPKSQLEALLVKRPEVPKPEPHPIKPETPARSQLASLLTRDSLAPQAPQALPATLEEPADKEDDEDEDDLVIDLEANPRKKSQVNMGHTTVDDVIDSVILNFRPAKPKQQSVYDFDEEDNEPPPKQLVPPLLLTVPKQEQKVVDPKESAAMDDSIDAVIGRHAKEPPTPEPKMAEPPPLEHLKVSEKDKKKMKKEKLRAKLKEKERLKAREETEKPKEFTEKLKITTNAETGLSLVARMEPTPSLAARSQSPPRTPPPPPAIPKLTLKMGGDSGGTKIVIKTPLPPPPPERKEKPPKAEKTPKPEKPPKFEKTPKPEKPPKPDKPPKLEKTPKAEKPPKTDKPSKTERRKEPTSPPRPPRQATPPPLTPSPPPPPQRALSPPWQPPSPPRNPPTPPQQPMSPGPYQPPPPPYPNPYFYAMQAAMGFQQIPPEPMFQPPTSQFPPPPPYQLPPPPYHPPPPQPYPPITQAFPPAQVQPYQEPPPMPTFPPSQPTPPGPEGETIWICPACSRPDDGSPMVGCDNCDDWYHWPCVGITEEPTEDKWFCPRCSVQPKTLAKKKTKRKKHKP